MQTFAISNLHLDDNNVRQDFGYSCIDKFHDYIKVQWNTRVPEWARVIIVGNVTDTRYGLTFLKELTGVKWLVLGSQDIQPYKAYKEVFEHIGGPIIHENILFTHIPVHPKAFVNYGDIINVHGEVVACETFGKSYVNVAAKRLRYKPTNLSEIF